MTAIAKLGCLGSFVQAAAPSLSIRPSSSLHIDIAVDFYPFWNVKRVPQRLIVLGWTATRPTVER